MITLVSTPGYPDPLDPTIICRWLATESANNFRLFRQDWLIDSSVNNGGFLEIHTSTAFTGADNDVISVYNLTNAAMSVGTITAVAGDTLTTDITWVVGMDIEYMNDNTLYGGYYFEGRLTINNIIEPLTVIASPDSFGYADLDVSGVLRIKTSLLKIGDYSTTIMKETTKSGKFSFEYRGCWYGSSESWTAEGDVIWYYGECVRSEEQGSNLHDYVVNAVRDAPFLNSFERPVYFLGLPFDLSFILPQIAEVSPPYDLIVTMKIYNSANTQLGPDVITAVDIDSLEGFINSLNISPASIPALADHITVEITI
jgi:hypothetical protein